MQGQTGEQVSFLVAWLGISAPGRVRVVRITSDPLPYFIIPSFSSIKSDDLSSSLLTYAVLREPRHNIAIYQKW